jgi:hypothetical protein
MVTVPLTAPDTAPMIVPRNNPQLISVGADTTKLTITTTKPATANNTARFKRDFGADVVPTEEFACSFTPSVYERCHDIGTRVTATRLNRSGMAQHPLQSHPRKRPRLWVDSNHIRRASFGYSIEHPQQVLLVNAIHRCAKALTIRKDPHEYIALGCRLRDPVHQVNLGANRPTTTALGVFNSLNDVLR